MESITNQAAEQFRNNMEDRRPLQPEVMSRVEETKDGGEAEKMTRLERKTTESITDQAAEQFRNNIEDRIPTQPEVMSGVEETKDGGKVEMIDFFIKSEWFSYAEIELERVEQIMFRQIKEEGKREEREVWGAAEQIKIETQKLQQHTTSQSDPKVTHTAGFIQKMSEEMLKQKERLSDNKMSVKETCREVKIVLQQITHLVEDKLQSLSEDAKLKLESLIKNFRKMTASMWKLMFCALLLYRLREVLDSLKSDSYISLSRGRLKYAFKMASMLALWLSHDVETNPGPEFNLRDCIEKLVRQFSETLKNDLEIGGTIWSDKVAKAAYNAGFSNNFRWKNPSGKNKDSLPDLIERAKELGRVLTERNCLPGDLAPFAVNLDHQETQDRLRQHLKTENFRAAVDAFMSEPYFFPSTNEKVDCLTQLLQEKVSNSKRHHTARPPPLTPTHSEFGHLADSQSITNTDCETNSIISNVVTASELCTATGMPCHDMLTGGTMVEGAETDSSPGRLSNSLCTLSTSTPDTSDTPRQDIIEPETTVNSDFVRMTLESIRENEMKSTHTSDETFYADLSSGLYNCMQGNDVNTAVTDTDTEMNDVPLPTDTADEALLTSIGNDPFSVMTGDYRNTSSSDALNPDNSPDDETQQDAADEGCEEEETDTSQPSREAVVPTENNRLDQPNTATDRCQDQNVGASRDERTERHESQSVAGLGANSVTSTHVSEIEPQADERKSAEENEYITKSEFQAFLSQQYVSNSGIERRLQELEALNGLVKASTSYRPDLTLNQVHLGESDTSLGSISASGGVTVEAGSRKRKRRQQHRQTKKIRQ